ncbi:MAG: sigma 54-interacting transcriptional regulator [Desulfobacterales bacterium]|nr:sigma 54-interacting transcriptional regulator [Desulfobacterales bacterium]
MKDLIADTQSILIVDDEPNNIQLLGNILKSSNYRVEFALNGKEALEWTASEKFDLILLDVNMPEMTGFEVCRKLRKQDGMEDVPVIFLSAMAEIVDKIRGFEAGGNDYVSKPFQPGEVIIRIEHHLQLARTRNALSLALQEKEASNLLLNAILGSIPETLITVDKDRNLLNVNQKQNTVFDAKEDNKNAVLKMLEDEQDPCCRIILKTLETKAPIKEYQVTRHDAQGNNKKLDLSTVPLISRDNEFTGVLLVVNDVTRIADLETQLHERQSFRNIIGKSQAMQQVYTLLEQISDVEINVLVCGESGTGKELVADALHYGSKRAKEPLVKVNCAALSENLLESELFGHVKGAFTGATANRIGRFQAAHKGTIFLDEIGDISPGVQAKLLRVLEQKEFQRIGESKTVQVDVRVVAATNVNLKLKIETGEFREDLYYRLKGMIVDLPALSKRTEDIPLLCDHFLNRFKKSLGKDIQGVSDSVMTQLATYPWPGNIRELRHAIEHACILCPGGVIQPEHLPAEISVHQKQGTDSPFKYAPKLTPKIIKQALEENRWNKAKTAKVLGIGRNTLYRYMEKYGIDLR